jgi:hypothetical protein
MTLSTKINASAFLFGSALWLVAMFIFRSDIAAASGWLAAAGGWFNALSQYLADEEQTHRH